MVTRRELYGLVWSKPMTKVAEELGVSGSYMVRVCLTLNVPCPARGYWAKLAAGKAPPPEPIPEARPGDPPEWSKDTQLPSHRFRNPTILKRRILPPSAGLGGQHALLRGTREHYLKSRYDKETEYLKAAKKNLPDITASKAGLDTAMEFANALYTALETEGYRTILAPNHEPPSRDHIDKH